MGFTRWLLGGVADDAGRVELSFNAAEIDADERNHELEVLRGEQARLDELAQRQLRYAAYAWQPPAQGGDRRADDRDAPEA